MSTGIVGAVAGPHSSIPATSGTVATDDGSGTNFAIGGLTFRLAISDESPYERATAQFRKEQFDNSGTPGDQSLMGMWTRGQFSFHKGAGVTYYETLDGESVLNRFSEAEGVKPFTPGELTLQASWDNALGASVTDVTWGGSGPGWIALLDGGVFKAINAFGDVPTSLPVSAGTITHAAAGTLCSYVATTSNKIERIGLAPNPGGPDPVDEVLYTHSTGFNGLFYAKDRLWAVDTASTWYQLTPNPTGAPIALSGADEVFTAGDNWDENWCLAEAPMAVLIGNGSRVYSVSVGTDGAVPTMSGPVQVAELPTGEIIRGLIHHLGFVVMSTSAGIRVAFVAEDASLTTGPLIVEWTETSGQTTLAKRGSSVFVAGGAIPALYEVALDQQVGDGLEFGWTKHANPYTGGTWSAYGAFCVDGTTLVAWCSDGAKYESSDLAESGTLTTGFHRFGTLEPKKFHSVRVRVAGEGGSVNIAKVLADGSSVSLYTIDVSASDGDLITLRMAAPAEMVALRFTLAPDDSDATVGPTLLGYQLKAIPSPQRQRMIRVPLQLFDSERAKGAPAVGYRGSAWDRLEELERMESSGGTHIFQDFRTGEAGECYIEQVEHRGTTPPGVVDNGYGGVVLLTLRKL